MNKKPFIQTGEFIASHNSDLSRKDEFFKIATETYGKDNVAAITNINKLKLKSLVKDLAKFYQIDYQEVNAVTREVDKEIQDAARAMGKDKTDLEINYQNAIQYSPTFQVFIEENPQVGELIEDLAGEQRSLGRHAGGLCLADGISSAVPIIMSKGVKQTAFTKDYLESMGVIKFDMLGLATMQLFEDCISLILKRHHGVEEPTFEDIRNWYKENLADGKLDLEDQKVYEHVFHKGNFAATFQVTQPDTQKYFMRAKPRSIVNLATLTSYYRPGAMASNLHEEYVKRRHDASLVHYDHPIIEEVLEETHGLLCLSGDSMIKTVNGPIKISSIVEQKMIGKGVYSYNEEKEEFELDEITHVIESGEKEVFELKIGEKTLKLTENHPIFTKRGWVEVKDLLPEDEILCNDD